MKTVSRKWITVGAVSSLALAMGVIYAQPPAGFAPPGAAGGSGRGGGGRGANNGAAVFAAMDANNDGSVTKAEVKATFDKWYAAADPEKKGSVSAHELTYALTPVINRATPETVSAMEAALPTAKGAKPLHARKVLVFGNAEGFVHSSIPLAAKTVEELGNKGDLWSTTISYNPADINAANLKQYDLIFLDSTTGCFLDDPKDPAATAARRKAFMDFVNGGKGIAGIHAASDSYHTDCSRSGGGGGSTGPAGLANAIVTQAGKTADQKVTKAELEAVGDAWYGKLNPGNAASISKADFESRFNADVMPPAGGGGGFGGRGGSGGFGGRGGSGRGGGGRAGGAATASAGPHLGQTPPGAVLDWPEFNKLIGGYFKFHWVYPQLITTKIDDPKSPLTAMFHGQEFEIHDETYTFAQDSFSRKNVHVLTSIDYDKMSQADKDKELPASTARTDGDYALSYIHAQGKGRVFYEAHGHSETIYAMTPMLEHVRAGIQYALGDLKADDSPSVK